MGGGNATYHEIRNMNFEYKRGERKKGKEFINSKDSKKKKKERIQRWAKKNFESEIKFEARSRNFYRGWTPTQIAREFPRSGLISSEL